MQFYARFQDEVVAEPALIAAHVQRARAQVSPAFRTIFEFSTRFLEREGLLPGFVAGYTKIHHDEHRHIGYGVWFLARAVSRETALGEVVRATLRELLPAVAESLTPPPGADASSLGACAEELRGFALDGLTRRLSVIGVPIESL
jgi:ribonucleoside-diphosphate reductase beta chain